eukprot:8541325-Ditylum_brightwellii.AAC.1
MEENGDYPMHLVIPVTIFTATFSKIGIGSKGKTGGIGAEKRQGDNDVVRHQKHVPISATSTNTEGAKVLHAQLTSPARSFYPSEKSQPCTNYTRN